MTETVRKELGVTDSELGDLLDELGRPSTYKSDEDFARLISWLSKRNVNTNIAAYSIFEATRLYLNRKYAHKIINFIAE